MRRTTCLPETYCVSKETYCVRCAVRRAYERPPLSRFAVLYKEVDVSGGQGGHSVFMGPLEDLYVLGL